MSIMLFENPLLIGFIGVVTSLMAGFIWLQTGYRSVMIGTVGLLAMTVGAVLLNVNVVTDREHIEQILYSIAAALGKNDYSTVYGIIHPTAEQTVIRAKAELPNYKFSEARVTGIKDIQVNRFTKPATAIAEFYVFVAVSTQGNEFDVRRFIRVYFMQREGRWLVHNYEHYEPTAGFREQSSSGSPQSPMEMWKQNR